MAISRGPRRVLRRLVLVYAAASAIVGCGRSEPVATPYDVLPIEMRTPEQFRAEAEVFEIRLARLHFEMDQPDAMERIREMMGAVESAQRSWRRVAGHFALGFGEPPFPLTNAYRRARDHWVQSVSKVSEGMNEVLRYVSENRMPDALNSMYDTRVALDELWFKAGFTRPEIRSFKLIGLLSAAREIPPGRRASIAQTLDADMAKGMRYLAEDTMAGITVKEIAVGRMLVLARIQSAVNRGRDTIRMQGSADRFPGCCDQAIGFVRELEKVIEPVEKDLSGRRD